METETGEAEIAEAEERRGQGENRKKVRRVRKKEAEEKKGGRRVGYLGRGRGSSKIRRGGKKTGPQKVPLEDKGVWQETIGENAYMKDLEPCH